MYLLSENLLIIFLFISPHKGYLHLYLYLWDSLRPYILVCAVSLLGWGLNSGMLHARQVLNLLCYHCIPECGFHAKQVPNLLCYHSIPEPGFYERKVPNLLYPLYSLYKLSLNISLSLLLFIITQITIHSFTFSCYSDFV